MRAILMSIKAQHNRNIEAGEKTSELRKRVPQCDYPIKVYTYESGFDGRHKVVNEWICKSTTEWRIVMGVPAHLQKVACVSTEDIREYSGKNYDNIIEMKISDLKIYDKPKELSEFKKPYKARPCELGKYCEDMICEGTCKGNICPCEKISRPPQSWCYVEDIGQ